MPKGTTFANDIVNLFFRATPIANLADNAAASPLTDLYMSLHTADPGAAGNQQTNETSYTNYARVAVSRSGTGWDAASGGATQNAALIQAAQCGATGATLTHVMLGTASSGTGKNMYYGALNSPLAVSNGIQPQFAAGALTVTES